MSKPYHSEPHEHDTVVVGDSGNPGVTAIIATLAIVIIVVIAIALMTGVSAGAPSDQVIPVPSINVEVQPPASPAS